MRSRSRNELTYVRWGQMRKLESSSKKGQGGGRKKRKGMTSSKGQRPCGGC